MALRSTTFEKSSLDAARDRNGTEESSFGAYLRRIAPEIDARIAEHLASLGSSNGLNDGVERMLLSGKRLRGAIVILAFDSASREPLNRNVALDLAAVVELAHSASLILDDIIDEDDSRRGEPALHITMGEKLALLNMMEVIALPYAIASKHGSRFVEHLAKTHRLMVNGVLSEVSRSRAPTSKLYEQIITLKTGALFSLAARYGAMAAEADVTLVDALAEYGLLTGKAMQIADDIADLRLALEKGAELEPSSETVLLRLLVEQEWESTQHGDGNPPAFANLDGRPTSDSRCLLEAGMMRRLDDELAVVEEMATELRTRIGRVGASGRGDVGHDLLLEAPREITRIVLAPQKRRH
ncbi:MAG: polyprenyl synthetase family protein [Methanomassiliicoccales archaeon]|jgi:geranylgeranyl diphosphate synthase type II